MSLLNNIHAWNMIIQTAAGSMDLTSNDGGGVLVDMQGYEGLLMLGILDTVTAAGTVRMYPQISDSTSTTDLVSCTGAAYIAGTTATAAGHADQIIALDVYKPLKRYVGVYVDKATQPTEIRVIGIAYKSHKGPVTHSTGASGMLDPTTALSPTT